MELLGTGTVARLQRLLLDTTVDVYDANGAHLQQAGVRAHWMKIDMTGVNPAQRSELLRRKELRFDPTYVLSPFAQVADAQGVRWNVDGDTVDVFRNGDQAVYGRADMVRVD